MPSKTDTQKGSAKRVEPDDLDNYFLEDDFEDDPFGSPNANTDKNKRKEPEGLGIDEEVSVQKRARVPRVKLDETRSGPFLDWSICYTNLTAAADCSQKRGFPSCEKRPRVSS